MSGVFKAIGKVFKGVVKVVKKIAPIALAGAAIVFTGGAALGVLPTFASAVGGLVGSLGVGSALAPILTSTIVNAGFGAATGLITGQGAGRGALMGGLMGAATGALGAGGILGTGAQTGQAASAGATAGATGASVNSPLMLDPTGSFGVGATAAPAAAAGTVATGAVPAAASGGGLGGLLGNPMFMGQALQGLGAGISAKAQVNAEERARQREVDRINANYGIGEGLMGILNRGSGQAPSTQQVAEQATYDPMASAARWVYDPRIGKLVRQMPDGTVMAA